jgi:hypothetical protein
VRGRPPVRENDLTNPENPGNPPLNIQQPTLT